LLVSSVSEANALASRGWLWHRGGVVAGGIAPGFVVAAPSLRDPNFARSVVLLVEHGRGGSLGFVVNRPSPLRWASVARALGLPETEGSGLPIFTGGPVSPHSGWILFDPRLAPKEHLEDAILLSSELAVSASKKALERIAQGGWDGDRVLTLGYAGWAGGQLDSELESGVWLPIELDASLVFRVAPEERWERVLRHGGIEPGRIVSPRRRPGDHTLS
jgi:putative transcriptional regulator